MRSVAAQQYDIVNELLQAGAQVDGANEKGQTALSELSYLIHNRADQTFADTMQLRRGMFRLAECWSIKVPM
jgi:ankyrin repeat protein